MDVDLQNQTAIVTGAAQGIGAVIARELGRSGASVVVADVQDEKGRDVAADIESEGTPARFVRCDVTSVEDTRALASTTTEEFGSIDVLVNNAAIESENVDLEEKEWYAGQFGDINPDHWRRVLDTNLTGPFNCAGAVVPTMRDQDGGHIVNISSMAGRNVSYGGGQDYTASKWGVVGFTKHLAWDLGKHGIRVNCVCPGMVLTPRNETELPPDLVEARRQNIALDEFPRPTDIADGVRYLVSDSAAKQTGTVMEIDSGEQLGPRPEVIEDHE